MNRAIKKIDLESIPGTVTVIDAGGAIVYANQQCIEATGFRLDEMVGHPWAEFCQIPSHSFTAILQCLKQRSVWRKVVQHKRKDGTSFGELCAVSLLPVDGDPKKYFLKVGHPLESSDLQETPAFGRRIPEANMTSGISGTSDDCYAILDAAPYAIGICRMADQRHVLVNQAFCRYTGYSSGEALGKTSQELNLFHDPADWERMHAAVQGRDKLDGLEVTFRRKDFRLTHGLISVRPVDLAGDLCLLYISQNIEEVNTAQEALRQSVENYRTIIEGAPVSIAITRLSDSIYQEVNDSFCRRVHYRREEILGHTPPDLKFYTDLEDRRRFLELFAEQGYVDDQEIRFQDKYGKTLDSLVSARRLRYKGEDCLLYISTRIDNLKAAQRALAEREENYRTILDLAPYNISITRRSDGVYMQVNKAFSLRTGYAADEALGRTAFDLNLYVNPSDRDQLIRLLERNGYVDSVEVPFRVKGGRIVESLISMRFIHFQDVDCIISMTVEISELKAAQRALEESEARFRTIFETAADPIFLSDMETGRFLDVNPAACRHLGYGQAEFLAMSLNQIHAPEGINAMPRFSEDLAEGNSLFFETQHLRKDGSKAIVEVSSQQMMHQDRRVLLCIVRDVTERKQIEAELARYRKSLEEMVTERTKELKAAQRELVKKEKMAVLGQITATVSHELRNPLRVIRTSNFYLHRKMKSSDPIIEKHFNRVDEQVSLCDAIVAYLLEYTEGRQAVRVYQDVTRWLAEVVESQRKQKELDLALRISPDLPKLSYDQEKMRRVMVNLLQNATEAINDRVEENERRGASYTPAIAIDARLKGDCVVIEIQDNGIGMDPNTLAHAFEPLFTTRSQKTGMGLAIVKKIVEEHDGSIILESRRGIGTRAQLTLPLKESRLEH